MDLLQFSSVLGSIVLIVGLLRAHRYVVREFVVPNMEPSERADE